MELPERHRFPGLVFHLLPDVWRRVNGRGREGKRVGEQDDGDDGGGRGSLGEDERAMRKRRKKGEGAGCSGGDGGVRGIRCSISAKMPLRLSVSRTRSI